MKHNRIGSLRALIGLTFFLAAAARGQTPQWIWSSANNIANQKEVRFFRKTFTVHQELLQAILTGSGDDNAEFFINGKKVASVNDWKSPATVDVTKNIVVGENVIAARCVNEQDKGGLIARLDMTIPTGGSKAAARAGARSVQTLVSDTTWFCFDKEAKNWTQVDFNDDTWQRATSLGKLGVDPWGEIFSARDATSAESIHVEPGFKVQLLHSATPTEGSWIDMTIDTQGRLIISPQDKGKLLRLTIAKGVLSKIEPLDAPVGGAMGLLYADDCLFLDGSGPKGWGIYRLRAVGDGFGEPEMIRKMSTGGEHGSHAIVLGPDHKLYIVSGNFTKVPSDILASSPHRNFADDQLLPWADDGRGFGAGLHAPGGFVMRMDEDGRNCELFAAGTRNTYDVAFNTDGELIGFDSDMEWDWGAAWYRPTRVNHWVAGGDYGFREGSGKFPEYFEDTLPATLNIGLGSPTGVMFATQSKFPKFYRDACFMEDWTYGRIFAIHFTPDGSTYDATAETVLRGIPLNLTSLEIGHDGALYFITGGRGTESGLYRLTYNGPRLKEPRLTATEKAADEQARAARHLRHDLESLYGKHDPRIVDAVWSSLGSEDRWIRYAARIALESQDVAWWKDRAVAETDTDAGLTALMALARCGGKETQRDLLLALKKFPLSGLSHEEELIKLRVIELSFSRQGRPAEDLAQLAIEKLDPLYPADNLEVNRELCQLLLYLQAPDAVAKTVALLDKAPTQEEQTYYAMRLRTITNGWTIDLRKDYLGWFDKNREHIAHPADFLQYFKDVDRDYSDGASFPQYLENFRNEAVATLSDGEREDLAAFLPKEAKPAAVAQTDRKFIKDWRMTDLVPDLDNAKTGRSYRRGKAVFTQAQCIACHRFGNSGGSVGPELAGVSSRLAPRDILESILEPSKVVSEQYQNIVLTLKDGEVAVGRLLEVNDQKLVLMTDPINPNKVEFSAADVVSRRPSKISPMPDGLVNSFSEGEILDLIAYLESGGKRTYAAFQK
ncbi:MAG TPA: c-type cytochrome [Verrucomicrobiae bacterium]|nr:c-type cytochrome [Verrucomicrobiae bacterium]